MVWSKGIRNLLKQLKGQKVHAYVRFVLIGGNDNAADSIPEKIRSWVSDGFVEWWGFVMICKKCIEG